MHVCYDHAVRMFTSKVICDDNINPFIFAFLYLSLLKAIIDAYLCMLLMIVFIIMIHDCSSLIFCNALHIYLLFLYTCKIIIFVLILSEIFPKQ